MSYNEARELWLAEEEQRLLVEINEIESRARKLAYDGHLENLKEALEEVREGIVREPMEEEVLELAANLAGTWEQ